MKVTVFSIVDSKQHSRQDAPPLVNYFSATTLYMYIYTYAKYCQYSCSIMFELITCFPYYRKRVEFGLVDPPDSAAVSDEELMSIIEELRHDYPDIGESMAVGYLRAKGYRVTRARVRNALHTNDPLSAALRWHGGITNRRVYSVAGPNSLWHIGMF